MKTIKTITSKELPIKFQMNPLVAEIADATQRNKESLESMISAFEKYNEACKRASATLSVDLEKCRIKLYPKTKPGSVLKK